jgi:putative toxin-antitoxin system antitoxin component (TIGR02293 family)
VGDETDRRSRLAGVAARAAEVLGTTEKADRWLQRPNRALGGRVPLELLDTDAGTQQVAEVLGRIEHGVYS